MDSGRFLVGSGGFLQVPVGYGGFRVLHTPVTVVP